ncbi:MAG: gliding motility-associated C-terminal domain-containing protein [Flavobacteriaceae bacterium]|nr:gliding motility-associated C-terminal domain-containing protein [Flavobacteriaceae bacterium]
MRNYFSRTSNVFIILLVVNLFMVNANDIYPNKNKTPQTTGADLAITNIEMVTQKPVVGQPVSIIVTIENQGDVRVENVLILATPGSGFSDVVIVTPSIDINAGDSSSFLYTLTLEATGDYTFNAEIVNIYTDIDSDSSSSFEDDDLLDGVDDDDEFQYEFYISDLSLIMTSTEVEYSTTKKSTITLSMTNDGPNDVDGNVISSFALPTNVSSIGEAIGDGSYSVGLWTVNSLAVGETKTIDIEVEYTGVGDFDFVSEIISSSSLDSDSSVNNGNVSEDDYTAITVTTIGYSDLSISSSLSNPHSILGELSTITLTITNDGPDGTGSPVSVEMYIPSGFQYVSNTTTVGLYDLTNDVWEIPSLANGATESIDIIVEYIDADNYLFEAQVISSPNTDIDSTPNNGLDTEDDYTSIEAQIIGVSDLDIEIRVNLTNVNTGDNGYFIVRVNNEGPNDSPEGAVVQINLPNGMSFVNTDSNDSYDSTTNTWTLEEIAVGGFSEIEIEINYIIGDNYTFSAEIIEAINIDSDSTVNNNLETEDDYASSSVTVGDSADLKITAIVDDYNPEIDDEITMTVTIDNLSNMVVPAGVTVLIPIPSGYTYISDDSAGSLSGSTWTLGEISENGSYIVNIILKVKKSGLHSMYLNIDRLTLPDFNSYNNRYYLSVIPNIPIDLELTYSVDITEQPYSIGQEVNFTFTLTNKGLGLQFPIDLPRGVKVQINIPSEYRYISNTQGYRFVNDIWSLDYNILAGHSTSITIRTVVTSEGNTPIEAQVYSQLGFIDTDSSPNNIDEHSDESLEDDEVRIQQETQGDIPEDIDISVIENSINNRIDVFLENSTGQYQSIEVLGVSRGSYSLEDNDTPELSDDYILYTPYSNYYGGDTIELLIVDIYGVLFRSTVNITVLEDRDNDGIPDGYSDLDSDGDGITDEIEGEEDSDGDGIPNNKDIDSDGDGILDTVEAQSDLYNIILPEGIDENGNGLDDAFEQEGLLGIEPVDTDGDDIPDYLDSDSDDDQLPDLLEAHDFDFNGEADYYPKGNFDISNNGLNEEFQASNHIDYYYFDYYFNLDLNHNFGKYLGDLPDLDLDGIPNFRDTDDDNDGEETSQEIDDAEEGEEDCNDNGIPNYLDKAPCNLDIPKAFTPNGDGENDIFIINNLQFLAPNFTLTILNMKGETIYKNSNNSSLEPNWWNGTSNYSALGSSNRENPEGTYYYRLDLNNGSPFVKGYLYLKR